MGVLLGSAGTCLGSWIKVSSLLIIRNQVNHANNYESRFVALALISGGSHSRVICPVVKMTFYYRLDYFQDKLLLPRVRSSSWASPLSWQPPGSRPARPAPPHPLGCLETRCGTKDCRIGGRNYLCLIQLILPSYI